MYLRSLKITNHPVLKDLELNFVNPTTNAPYRIIAFVGENGCGKTTLLNEIYENNNSKFELENTSPIGFCNHCSLFLRQNSLAKNAMREANKMLNGTDPFPSKNVFARVGLSEVSSPLLDSKKGTSILMTLNDFDILKIFNEDTFDQISCAKVVTTIIGGQTGDIDISQYSSGQQEILLKLKDLKEYNSAIDCVLLDEPETSLHPRWQKQIINIVESLLKDSKGETPQIFLATHSEKVLESLISREDVLIIRLSKEKGIFKTESISEMNLCLPTPTFAELDYVVFHIPTMDYHDQLFTYFGAFFDKDTSTAIDLKIERKLGKIYGKNNIEQFKKERAFAKFNKVYATKMLPTYIRDYFHHPNEIVPPTEEELEKSIKVMRELIKYMKDADIKEVEDSDESNE